MFGIDSLDFLEDPKPLPRPKLRRSLRWVAGPVVIAAVVVYVTSMPQPLLSSKDLSDLLVFLVAIAVNLLVSVGLGYLAYRAARNRMDGW